MRRMLTTPLATGLALLALASAGAGAQGYARPTTLIVPVGMSRDVETALKQACADKCKGTRWADRTFSEGLSTARVIGGKELLDAAEAEALLTALQSQGVTREAVLRQFLAVESYEWRLDTLQARANYSVSVAEAQRRVNEINGAAPEDFRTIPATFVIALHGGEVTSKASGKSTQASAQLSASVFRISYATPEEVVAGLSAYFCGKDCADKVARQAAFAKHPIPFDHIASFDFPAAVSVSASDGPIALSKALGEDILEQLTGEMAEAIAEFKVRERVVATDPPAVRIGKKEGVTPGARFFHYEVAQDESGNQILKRRAVLNVRKVADNRVNAIDVSGAVGAKVASVDSTTFRHAFPGSVNRGDVIEEKPSLISLHAGAAFLEGAPGVFAEVRTEELAGQVGLPPNIRVIGTFKTFVDELLGERARTQFIGAGVAYELHPLRGRLRLTPLAIYNLSTTKLLDDTSTDSEDGTPGLEVGVDFGLRITPTIEISGMVRQAAYTDLFELASGGDGLKSGLIFGVGARLQRGRWGF
jgi:hypothetical protein